MSVATLDDIADDLVNTLDGAGGRPSPMGNIARRLVLGTLLREVATRLQALEDEVGASGVLTVDQIDEATAAAGVLIDGLLLKDKRLQPTGSGISTGDAGVSMKDNLASAFDFKEAANVYLQFITSNDAERVKLGKLMGLADPQTIDMADAQVALVLGTAGAGQVKLLSNILYVDANSSATEDLLLPPEASCTGLFVVIVNTGGEDIILKEDSDTTTLATISTTEIGIAFCNGTTWFGGVLKVT